MPDCPSLTPQNTSSLAAGVPHTLLLELGQEVLSSDSPGSRFMALDKQQNLPLALCRPPQH